MKITLNRVAFATCMALGSDVGYAAGLQVGILQELNGNISIEGGYRYLRTNTSTEMAPHGAGKAGGLDLHSSSQLYLGANFAF